MRKNMWIALAMVLILPAVLFTVSCAKQAVETQPAVTETPPPETAPADTSAQDAEKARMEAERMRAEELERARQEALNMFVNEDIHFDFDSAALTPTAQQILNSKADYMSANPSVTVTIEGNCDERGTEAYNMALGERRAEAARAYLVNLGIAANRLSTISYGEERPIDPAHNEEAWAKNRRDHFAID